MSTVSSATERERLPISVAICGPWTAAVPRSVTSRYEFAIGSLCPGLFWDALAAHSGAEQRRCQSRDPLYFCGRERRSLASTLLALPRKRLASEAAKSE